MKYSSEEENPSDSLNFDSNFPWEDSDASLVKYDSLRSYRPSQGQVGPLKEKQSTESSIDEAFKSGEFLGWEPARRRGNSEQEVLTKTLCFCCDEEKEAEEKAVFLSSDFSHRRKRTLKIQDVHQSQQVLKHKEYIHDSLTCLDQEPIGNVQFSLIPITRWRFKPVSFAEVILVFGSSSTTTTTEAPKIPPQLSELIYQNYDPVKLQIHDDQPSPFQRRNSDFAEETTLVGSETIAQLNRLLNNVQNKVETVDAVQLESSETDVKSSELSEPSRPSAILKQPSKPLVNTLPGYNILRLLTGG